MPTLGIIPSRYASTRFPGKPLVDIQGKPMIQHVWEQVKKVASVDEVIVATDDQRIFDVVIAFGGKAAMTSSQCKTGTDRCAEVAQNMSDYDIIVNIQGDEPFIDPSQIETVIQILKNDSLTKIATLGKKIKDATQLQNTNVVKLIKDNTQHALYFSRHPIPFFREHAPEQWINHHIYYKHIGLYAFRRVTLLEIALLPQSSLEKAESLEQLRWLEHGYSIGIGNTKIETLGIDRPEDLDFLKI